MGYYVDLSKISIDQYKAKLENSDLLPSRTILKDRLDDRFDHFKNIGVKNIQELLQLLKKKDKLAELSKIEFFSGDYLAILLRELNSINPKPNKISEFSGISPATVSKLDKLGITNTEKLYDRVITPEKRQQLSIDAGIDLSEILELTKLADLSRIKWVGATFARMLHDVGTDTAEKASKSNFDELHKKINQINMERNYFKGKIGLNDMKLFVNAAKEVSFDIEY
jgi:hypothetical protein